MSTTGKSSVIATGCVGLALTGAAFVGNLRWMDGEFRVGGDPDTRAEQLAKSTIVGIQAVAVVGCCLLAAAIWRWRRGSTGALRGLGFLLEGLGGAGLLAAVCGLITNARGNLGDELDSLGATFVIIPGVAVAAIAGALGAWAIRSAGYRESRAVADAVAMGLQDPS